MGPNLLSDWQASPRRLLIYALVHASPALLLYVFYAGKRPIKHVLCFCRKQHMCVGQCHPLDTPSQGGTKYYSACRHSLTSSGYHSEMTTSGRLLRVFCASTSVHSNVGCSRPWPTVPLPRSPSCRPRLCCYRTINTGQIPLVSEFYNRDMML